MGPDASVKKARKSLPLPPPPGQELPKIPPVEGDQLVPLVEVYILLVVEGEKL